MRIRPSDKERTNEQVGTPQARGDDCGVYRRLSARSVILSAHGRGDDLQVRISAPAVGSDLPVIVSHGVGSSMDGYAPLVDYRTAHGLAVIQPTHLDAKRLVLAPDDPRAPDFWKFRLDDIKRVLDELDLIEGSLPGRNGRLNRNRIAAAGHSFGGFITSLLRRAIAQGREDAARSASPGCKRSSC